MEKKINKGKKKNEKSIKKTSSKELKVNKNKEVKKVRNKKNEKNLSDAICIMIYVIIVFGLCLLLCISSNKKWVREGNIISRGNETYEIGDYYGYDESNSGEITGLTDVEWKVMDVDEDGHLLIVADSNVEKLTLGSNTDLEKAKNDFVTGAAQMNSISKKYGNGKGAIDARGISNQDIINVLNLDISNIVIDESYSYYWGNDSKVISFDYLNKKVETDLYKDGKFHWFDYSKNEWGIIENDNEGTDDNPKSIITAKGNLIVFNATAYDKNYHNNFDEKHNYIGDDKRVDMLFSKSLTNPISYWTTNDFTFGLSSYVGYGYNVVKGFDLNYNYLVYSVGVSREGTFGVRPVVVIK